MNIDTFLAQLAADDMDEAEHAQALADYDALCHKVDTDPREQQRVHDIAALIDADAALYTDGLTAMENDEPAMAQVLLQRAADRGIGDAADILREISGTLPDPSADPAEQASADTPPDPATDEACDFLFLPHPAPQAADVPVEVESARTFECKLPWSVPVGGGRRLDVLCSDLAALDTTTYLLDHPLAHRLVLDLGRCGVQTGREDLAWGQWAHGASDLRVRRSYLTWETTLNELVKDQLVTRLRTLITYAQSRELGPSIQMADPTALTAATAFPPLPAGSPRGRVVALACHGDRVVVGVLVLQP